LTDLLWSDPSDEVQRFTANPRGYGVLFGDAAVADFAATMKLRYIIRAHQCVESGVVYVGTGIIITVFSSSNYESNLANSCGMLHISQSGEINSQSLPPIPRVEFYSALIDVRGATMTAARKSNSLGKLRCASIKSWKSHPGVFGQISRNVSTILIPRLPARDVC
jgi:hypothetical protein